MPIKHAIWKIAKSPEPLHEIVLAIEQEADDMIVAGPGNFASVHQTIMIPVHTFL